MMGKVLYWPSRGQPKAGGHRHWAPAQKGGVICEMVVELSGCLKGLKASLRGEL